ncbi:hypothetical protein WMY93_031362 [Mugilogobius chulae]|uniref:ribonuclease H n=1 Tax=Mugilogobius chulae TaxID=88201 RepID=A0AAW0MLM6_9GOBI
MGYRKLLRPFERAPSRCRRARLVAVPGSLPPTGPRVLPLTDFDHVWKELGLLSEPWLGRTLRRDYALQFARKPPPFRGISIVQWANPGETEALRVEVSSLLHRGAVAAVSAEDAHRGLYSPYFLVPKKSGGARPILDLRLLNEHIVTRSFCMLTTKQLLECVRPGDWMTSIDLTDAYFHVPVVPEHRKFLRFAIGEEQYEYCRLPFGYTLAQRTFSKCAEAALEPLRRQGIRILKYIDDWLILAASRQDAEAHTGSVLRHISRLGFVVNREKSSLQPAQSALYLGLHLNSQSMRASLSAERSFALTQMGQRVLGSPLVPARQIMSLLGMMAAAHPVVRLGPLHMRRLQRWFSRLRLHPTMDKGKMVCASTAARVDIQYWLTPGLLSRGVPLGCVPFHTEVFTDASLTGWGGVLGQSSVGGVWSGPRCHINLLEMEAVRRVLLHFSVQLEGAHVRVRSDNSTVVSYLNRQGGVRSSRLHNLTLEIILWATSHLASLRARYVPGVLNVGANRMSRGGPPRDEWGLAPDVAREVWSRFGRPVADLFASAENAQCPLWFSLRSTDEPPLGVDALAHKQWPAGLLYAFSPLHLMLPLLQRIRQEGLSVVVIAPNSPNARWFPSLVELAVRGLGHSRTDSGR